MQERDDGKHEQMRDSDEYMGPIDQELHHDILKRLVSDTGETADKMEDDRFENRSRLNESKTNQTCYVEDQSQNLAASTSKKGRLNIID